MYVALAALVGPIMTTCPCLLFWKGTQTANCSPVISMCHVLLVKLQLEIFRMDSTMLAQALLYNKHSLKPVLFLLKARF